MRALFTTWRVPLLLAVLCAGFAAVLAGIIDGPGSPPADPDTEVAAAADDATAERSFDLEPLESFDAVVERPLFSRTRRPLPVAAATKSDAHGGSAGVPFLLSGILIAGSTRVAFLQPRSEPKTLRVLEGETIEGWKIEKITQRQVVVGNGEVSQELTLQDRNAPVAAAAPDGRGQPGRGGRRPPPIPGREDMMPGGQPFPPGDEVDGGAENDAQ